jgi:3-methylfumaryl-CoA hydratase
LSDHDDAHAVGRCEEASDLVTPQLVARFRACLEPHLFDAAVPLGLHWCLAPHAAPMHALGPDGHAARGGFLPALPQLPRRMWAGGEIEHLAPLAEGDAVTRRSCIASVAMKQGRSGPLAFVAVQHEYANAAGVAIRERQDLVFREAADRATPTAEAAPDAEPPSDLLWALDTSPVLLFRYSALTFNGHRIHYDAPYATAVEGYAGLVVHGPLLATLMLNAAATLLGTTPRRFDYRGQRALIGATPARLLARRMAQATVACEVRDAGGRITMQASAQA